MEFRRNGTQFRALAAKLLVGLALFFSLSPCPSCFSQQSKLVVDCRRNSLYEGSEMCSMAAGSDK